MLFIVYNLLLHLTHMLIGCWLGRCCVYLLKIQILDNYSSHGKTSHCNLLLVKITLYPECHYQACIQCHSQARKKIYWLWYEAYNTDYNFIVATKTTALSLPRAKAESLSSDISNILSKACPPKQNISKEERGHIRSFAKRQHLLILTAGKCKAAVIMDSSEYKDKIKLMLSDVRVYEKLDKDPTPGYKWRLV